MIQGYLITAGVTALIAFGTGWKVKTWKVNGDHAKALEQQAEDYDKKVKSVNERNEELIQDLQDANLQKITLTGQLSAALNAARTPYTPIAGQIPAAVPKCDASGSVRYDANFVRLFNSSARAGTGRTENDSLAAGYPTE